MNPLYDIGKQAKAAAIELLSSSHEQRVAALHYVSNELRAVSQAILNANQQDIQMAQSTQCSEAFIDRLRLTDERLASMIDGLEQVAALPDPLGLIIEEWTRPNGLNIKKVPVPLGVIGFIYESRSSVTCDAAALCLKSGNAVILRGGKEVRTTNAIIMQAIRSGLQQAKLSEHSIQLLPSDDRVEVQWLCELNEFVDVMIPRGGKGLVSTVCKYALMPVLKHLDGICHVYVDRDVDMTMTLNIIDDAKTQRPGVCNAIETILVHQGIAMRFLPLLAARLEQRHVQLRGCEKSLPFLNETAILAVEEDWSTEYEDLIVSIKTVSNLDEAITHINHYGSHHSDAIMTTNSRESDQFMSQVDSACVYHNCSTRFSDGAEFGFGAEIGIGTDKLHARGPMALKELTTYKYLIEGNGQVKDASRLGEFN